MLPHPFRPARYNKTAACSCGHFDHFLGNRRRDGFVVFFEAGEITADRVPNARQRFRSRGALGNATGQRGAFRDENAVLIRFDQNSKLHPTMVILSRGTVNLIARRTLRRRDVICRSSLASRAGMGSGAFAPLPAAARSESAPHHSPAQRRCDSILQFSRQKPKHKFSASLRRIAGLPARHFLAPLTGRTK